VIEGRVDTVSTNGVDGELLKKGNITLAAVRVGEGVLEAGGLSKGIVSAGNNEALGLVGYSFYIESTPLCIVKVSSSAFNL
jgi:hypothetical protein